MSVSGQYLPPTSSLPRPRSLDTLSEEQISSALRNLHTIYCPLRVPLSFQTHQKQKTLPSISSTPVDSGYASRGEDEDEDIEDAEDALAALRIDEFERNFAIRWLTAFISRADELSLIPEAPLLRLIDDAASILASFSDALDQDEEADITRDFTFALSLPAPAPPTIHVRLNDASLSGTDHTDVGLQSWGASIILSSLMCANPTRFNLTTPSPRILELGAGTGLVALTLATLLPHLHPENLATVIATDYHPAVLANLRANIASNFPTTTTRRPIIQAALLDWSAPSRAPPLDQPASVLVAADVVYAPEHATWLRDCAAGLLAPEGVFWLIATVRPTGKFEGITGTVEVAFAEEGARGADGRVLRILETEVVGKRRGVGRGDESGYRLYRIGWA